MAIDPGHLQARQLLAVCRAYAGQLAPAIHDLEALRAASPRDEGILFLLGFSYLKNHDSEKAKVTFQQMFEAAGPLRAQFLVGKAYYEATLFPQAEESFLEVLRLDPRFPGARLELGKVYISLRRTDDAIRELEAVLKDNPGDARCELFPGRSAGAGRPLCRRNSLPGAGKKDEARFLGALLLPGEGQTPAGAGGGCRSTAATSRGAESG